MFRWAERCRRSRLPLERGSQADGVVVARRRWGERRHGCRISRRRRKHNILLDDQAAQEEEPLGKRRRSARIAKRRRDAEQEQILEQE
eukprot:2003831-Heterocapsa_arctica.AAC.1